MTVRFLADEDVRADIIQGLHSREPSIDIPDVKSAGLRGRKYPVLLELAAEQDRILLSHDRNTMTGTSTSALRLDSQGRESVTLVAIV